MERDSKNNSWKWITEDTLCTKGPCEVIQIFITSAAAAGTVTAYDGVDTNGNLLSVLEATTNISQQIHYHEPAYCPNGLYLDVGANVTGVFVMWRELPN